MVRKIKIGKIEMNFSDRWLYTFIALGVIIVLAWGVIAYTGNVGHTSDQIDETDPTVIASVKDGVDWSEVSGIPDDIDTYCSVSGNTISCPDGTSLTESGETYVKSDSCYSGDIELKQRAIATTCVGTNVGGCTGTSCTTPTSNWVDDASGYTCDYNDGATFVYACVQWPRTCTPNILILCQANY